VLSVEEVHAVARAADDEQASTLYVVAAMTGLRLGELRALKWNDVDFVARTVHVGEVGRRDRFGAESSRE
jgi:integrase